MATLKVNGELYKQLVIHGAANLRANYKVTNIINWFLGNTKLTSY